MLQGSKWCIKCQYLFKFNFLVLKICGIETNCYKVRSAILFEIFQTAFTIKLIFWKNPTCMAVCVHREVYYSTLLPFGRPHFEVENCHRDHALFLFLTPTDTYCYAIFNKWLKCLEIFYQSHRNWDKIKALYGSFTIYIDKRWGERELLNVYKSK